MAELFVASVDGGGSTTAAAIAFPDGTVRHQPLGGGCNPQDNPHWATALEDVLLPLRGAAYAMLGISGYGEVPAVNEQISTKVQDIIGPQVTVTNDVILTAQAAFPAGGGVLVLSGTGSMAVATGPLGTVRVGGWGDYFSDEGSAHWIGREALARASHERDGRTEDLGLAHGLEAALGLEDHGHYALQGWVLAQKHPRADIARLARIVNDLAEAGVPPARDILEAAALELAQLARPAARQAGLPGPLPWAFAGAAFGSHILRDALGRQLGAAPVTPQATALDGGLILAAEAAGWNPTPKWREKVSHACRS